MAFPSQPVEGPALLTERVELGDRLSAICHNEALPFPRPLHELTEPGLELFDSDRVRGVSGSHFLILEVVTSKVKGLAPCQAPASHRRHPHPVPGPALASINPIKTSCGAFHVYLSLHGQQR